MALTPPENRFWWNEPLHRMEIVWITVAFLWGIIMFLTMVYWHIVGKQNLSNEAYRIKPDAFAAKAEAFVAKYKVREEGDTKIPVVKPPAGGDAYLVARLWEWWPILELEKGQSYRLHMSSMDWQHGFSLQPTNINIQVHPNYEMVLTLTPSQAGEFTIICNEFCGIGHHNMLGRIHVVDRK
jgi:cytochrome c oxidase subunit 2